MLADEDEGSVADVSFGSCHSSCRSTPGSSSQKNTAKFEGDETGGRGTHYICVCPCPSLRSRDMSPALSRNVPCPPLARTIQTQPSQTSTSEAILRRSRTRCQAFLNVSSLSPSTKPPF